MSVVREAFDDWDPLDAIDRVREIDFAVEISTTLGWWELASEKRIVRCLTKNILSIYCMTVELMKEALTNTPSSLHPTPSAIEKPCPEIVTKVPINKENMGLIIHLDKRHLPPEAGPLVGLTLLTWINLNSFPEVDVSNPL